MADAQDRVSAQARRPLADLAWVFLRISSVALGGGMAMLPLMTHEFVERRGWLTEQEMVDVVAAMQSLPGLIGVNMAVLVGYRIRGAAGALVAVLSTVFVPFAVIAAVATGLAAVSGSAAVSRVFLGIRAGTAALILLSLGGLAKKVLTDPPAWILCGVALVATVVFRLDALLVILLGLTVGVVRIAAEAVERRRK